MSVFLGTLAIDFTLGIITNLASNALWDAKSHRDGEKKSEQLRQRIADFNRKYDDTSLDSSEFQQFFSERVVAEIFSAVFKPQAINGDFLASLPQQAFDSYKERCRLNGKSSGCDIGIFKKYFAELIVELKSIRTELLSLEHASQAAIIIDEDRTQHQITRGVIRSENVNLMNSISEMLRSSLAQINSPLICDNSFAWPTIKEIEALIDNRLYAEADNKISQVLNNKKTLSTSQIEFILYQRARMLINTHRHDGLAAIIDELKGINPNSTFIHEVNYFVACNAKDSALLKASIEALKQLGYSYEKCLLKEANYLMALQDFGAVQNLLFADDQLIPAFSEYHEANFYCGLLMANSNRFAKAFCYFEKAYG